MKEREIFIYLKKGNEMQGRIIGREGRNLRAFEKESGIKVIIGEGYYWIILKGADDYKLDRAIFAMNDLIKDGRIHPLRIEDSFRKYDEEIFGT